MLSHVDGFRVDEGNALFFEEPALLVFATERIRRSERSFGVDDAVARKVPLAEHTAHGVSHLA